MDPGEVVYRKNEGKKSRDTVPLKARKMRRVYSTVHYGVVPRRGDHR
jgi:hypothetical protein